jgi:hypothetical protein
MDRVAHANWKLFFSPLPFSSIVSFDFALLAWVFPLAEGMMLRRGREFETFGNFR